MARGGARVGAGRKKKSLAERALHGTASLKAKRVVLPPVEKFGPPEDLTPDEVEVWLYLSPHAFKARTLTPATADAFSDLCRNRVLMLKLGKGGDAGGADHRGLIQRVQSQMKDFSLSPMGKPLVDEAPKAADPFAEFDGTVN